MTLLILLLLLIMTIIIIIIIIIIATATTSFLENIAQFMKKRLKLDCVHQGYLLVAS